VTCILLTGFIRSNAVVALCPSGFDARTVCSALDTPVLAVFGGAERQKGSAWHDVLTLMEGMKHKKAVPYMIRSAGAGTVPHTHTHRISE
jgi:hypothetical protein